MWNSLDNLLHGHKYYVHPRGIITWIDFKRATYNAEPYKRQPAGTPAICLRCYEHMLIDRQNAKMYFVRNKKGSLCVRTPQEYPFSPRHIPIYAVVDQTCKTRLRWLPHGPFALAFDVPARGVAIQTPFDARSNDVIMIDNYLVLTPRTHGDRLLPLLVTLTRGRYGINTKNPRR